MAGTGVIEDFVSAKAFQQLEQVETYLSALNITLVESIRNAKAFSDALSGAKGLRDISVSSANASKELEKLNRLQAQTAKAQQDLARSTALNEQAQIRLTAARRREEEQLNRQTATANKAKTEYQKLTAEYNAATAAAREAGVVFGTRSLQFKIAAADANRLRAQLDSIDQPLGNFQRNVGNYAKGIAGVFSTAYGAIRTAANILPGLGISGIFLALFEGIKYVVTELGVLNTSLSDFDSKRKALMAAFDNTLFKESISSVIDLKEQIKLAKEGFIDSETVVKKYNDTIGKTVGQVQTLDQVEQQLKNNSRDYIKSMFFKAAAAAALSQGTDDLVKATKKLMTEEANATLTAKDLKQIRDEIAKGGSNAESYKGLLKIAENANRVDQKSVKNAKDNQDKLVNQTTSTYDKLLTLANQFAKNFVSVDSSDIQRRKTSEAIDYNNSLLQADADRNMDIANNDKKSYSERQSSLKKALSDRLQIIKNNAIKELDVPGIQADQEQAINDKKNAEILKTTIEFNKQSRDLIVSANRDRAALKQQELETSKKQEQAFIADANNSYDDRLAAVKKYVDTSKELVQTRSKFDLIEAGENSDKRKAVESKLQGDLADIDKEGLTKTNEIKKQAETELAKILNEGAKNANTVLQQEIIDLRDAQDTKLLEIEKYQSEALSATADLYRTGKISTAEYNQQVYDIEKQASKDRIDLQIQTLEKILETQQSNLEFGIGDPKEVQRTQNLITKLRIDGSNLATQVELDNIKKVESARKSLHDLEKQIADQSIELIQTLVDGSYQKQLDALSVQSDQLTKNSDKEKEVVDRSLATDEEKANKKNIIDAKTQAQQDVIAQKEREVKTRQAKFDKLISIAKIVEAVGIAEVQALSYLSNPFTAPLYPAIAAAIGALGALQLATVIATPIPKYAKGTDYHKGGAMIVGDAGTELVIEPNGKRYLTPDTDTLTTAPAGTKVLPNYEVIKMLAKPERINYVGGQAVDIQQLVSEQRKTTKAIHGQKMAGTFITKGGWKRQQQQVSNWNTYRNNHFN
jgi:hypothetical protein